MMLAESPNFTTSSPEVNPYGEILQHLQPVTPALSARRLSQGRGRDAGGTACAGIHLLGTVCGDAVLPIGSGAFVAGDLRRVGELRRQARASGHRGPEAVLAGLCQRPPAVGAVPRGVLSAARALPRGGRPEEVSVQEQA